MASTSLAHVPLQDSFYPVLTGQELTRQEARQVAADRFWFVAIILERFVTRLFSDKLGLLPSWTNFLDYLLLVLFFVYVAQSVRYRPTLRSKNGFGPLVLAFVLVVAVSALVNLDRLHLGAFSLFVVGFLEPLAFMALAYLLAPRAEVLKFIVRALLLVGLLQIAVVAFLDVPRFLVTRNPDVISGTFGDNPYQMTFFLLTWNVIILSISVAPRYKRLWQVSIVLQQIAIVVIILLAQFRSLLPFVAVTWLLTYLIVAKRPAHGILPILVGGAMFVGVFGIVDQMFPELKWGETLQVFERSEESLQSGKSLAVGNFTKLIGEEPQVLLMGTGPGTYASRGFRTFSIAGRQDEINIIYRRAFGTDYYVTDVAAKYVLPVTTNYAFGSATAASPWFSALSIPAELGIPGLLLVLALYGKAIHVCWRLSRRKGDVGILARWTLIGMALLLQMALLENWLEVSRLTVPLWLVFGLLMALGKGTETEERTGKAGTATLQRPNER